VSREVFSAGTPQPQEIIRLVTVAATNRRRSSTIIRHSFIDFQRLRRNTWLPLLVRLLRGLGTFSSCWSARTFPLAAFTPTQRSVDRPMALRDIYKHKLFLCSRPFPVLVHPSVGVPSSFTDQKSLVVSSLTLTSRRKYIGGSVQIGDLLNIDQKGLIGFTDSPLKSWLLRPGRGSHNFMFVQAIVIRIQCYRVVTHCHWQGCLRLADLRLRISPVCTLLFVLAFVSSLSICVTPASFESHLAQLAKGCNCRSQVVWWSLIYVNFLKVKVRTRKLLWREDLVQIRESRNRLLVNLGYSHLPRSSLQISMWLSRPAWESHGLSSEVSTLDTLFLQ